MFEKSTLGFMLVYSKQETVKTEIKTADRVGQRFWEYSKIFSV